MTNVSMFLDPKTGLPRSRDMGVDNEVLNVATLEFIDGSLPEDMEVALNKFMIETTVGDARWVRYPGADDNSVDNYIALVYLSRWTANQIRRYGNEHFWCFDPSGKFSFKYFFGRFIGFRPYVKARVSDSIGWLDAVLYSIGAIITALSPPDNTSDKCLQVLQNRWVRGRHWISDLGILAFECLMSRQYPAKLRTLYAVYFGVSHPFTLNVRTDRW